MEDSGDRLSTCKVMESYQPPSGTQGRERQQSKLSLVNTKLWCLNDNVVVIQPCTFFLWTRLAWFTILVVFYCDATCFLLNNNAWYEPAVALGVSDLAVINWQLVLYVRVEACENQATFPAAVRVFLRPIALMQCSGHHVRRTVLYAGVCKVHNPTELAQTIYISHNNIFYWQQNILCRQCENMQY